MKKIGVMLKHLGNSQLNYEFFTSANRLVKETASVDIICFVESPSAPVIPLCFAVMPVSEAKSFDGILISTNLILAELALENLDASRKVFYSYDLDWMRGRLPFEETAKIYHSEEHELVVRSEYHQNAFSSAFNLLPRVVPSFDISNLIKQEQPH